MPISPTSDFRASLGNRVRHKGLSWTMMVVGPFFSRVCIGLVKLVAVDLVLHVASEDHGQRNAGRHHGIEVPAVFVVELEGESKDLGPRGVGVAHLRHPGNGGGPHGCSLEISEHLRSFRGWLKKK